MNKLSYFIKFLTKFKIFKNLSCIQLKYFVFLVTLIFFVIVIITNNGFQKIFLFFL